MIFDSHAHYEDKRFDTDRVELLSAMRENNVGLIVNVGSTLETSKKSVELANQYSDIYAAVGIHPSEVMWPYDGDEDNKLSIDKSRQVLPSMLEELRQLASDKRCISIGEIGLDYYWDKEEDNHILQRDWFKAQLQLARELDLPVIVHSRDANQETYEIMKEAAAAGTKAVIHCYSGSAEMAKEYVKLGYYIGVGGVVTFKNGRRLRETVEAIHMDNILLETDCPYMAPEPYRGKRNDSTLIRYMIEQVAELKHISQEEVEEITWRNACRFYQLEV